MLKAIFYARFHPERGPSVIEQFPANAMATRASVSPKDGPINVEDEKQSSGKSKKTLINFSEVSSYIIPPYDLCGKSLSVCVDGYRVLGWPISLESEEYARNRFTFNVCFVLDESGKDTDHDSGEDGNVSIRTWEQVVKKTALFFQALEVDDGILAAEEQENETAAGHGGSGAGRVVKRLLENTFTQLDTYAETCIPVSNIHTLNLRLSSSTDPSPKASPKVHAHDVALLIRAMPSPTDWTPDLTLVRIIPHINGVHHIARIASLADVEVRLVKRAVRGLVSHGRMRLLDLCSFGAGYKLTESFGAFVRDDQGVTREGVRYFCSGASRDGGGEADVKTSTHHILTLYTALNTHQSVHDFALAQQPLLHALGIDIRRFVTFGVLKGFLRRVHKYVLALPAASSTTPQTKTSGGSSGGKFGSGSGGKRSNEDAAKDFERAWRKAALSSGWATPPQTVLGSLGDEHSLVSEHGRGGGRAC